MLGTLLIILLFWLLSAPVPRWGYSRDWGYFPSGGLGLVLLIVLILVLMGTHLGTILSFRSGCGDDETSFSKRRVCGDSCPR